MRDCDLSRRRRRLHGRSYIPEDFDYDAVEGISAESREKFKLVRPSSLGQASRISGVRVSDITVLLVYLKK